MRSSGDLTEEHLLMLRTTVNLIASFPSPSCHDCASAQGLRVASLCNLLYLEKV